MKLAVSPSRRLAVVLGIAAVAILLAVQFRAEASPQQSIPPVALRRNIATTYFGDLSPYIPCQPNANNPNDAHDRVQGVSMLLDGRILIAGNTVCDDYDDLSRYQDLGGAFSSYVRESEGFVAILSADLTQVEEWTYLPGLDTERAYLAVQDHQLNIWVVGFTGSGSGFAGGNTPIGQGGGWDAFVVKFDSDLSNKLWAVRIGGSDEDNPRASMTVVNEGGNPVAYISGHTASTNFPESIPDAIPPIADGCVWDAFIVKIKWDGTLGWSRVFGGNGHEDAYANVRVHPGDGSIYVGGFTRSTNLEARYPGLQGYNTAHNGQTTTCGGCPGPLAGCTSGDGFVARFSSTGTLLRWTYLGGTDDDIVSGNDGLELMPGTNQVVVSGNTKSASWPTILPSTLRLDDTFNSPTGVNDAYIAILSEDLMNLEFHSFFGGASNDEPGGLAVDDVGNIYFGGNTCSDQVGVPPFPIAGGAYDTTYAGDVNGDAFIAKIFVQLASPQIATLLYSTYFGGGVLKDPAGCGSTLCTGVNSENPTYCPGFEGDRVRSLMLMPNGNVLFSGDTDTTDFPTHPKVGPNKVRDADFIGGDSDGFISRHKTE